MSARHFPQCVETDTGRSPSLCTRCCAAARLMRRKCWRGDGIQPTASPRRLSFWRGDAAGDWFIVAGCSSREPLFQVLAQLGDGRREAGCAERETRFGRHRANTEKGVVVPRED